MFKKIKINTDRLLGLSAMMVSVITLIIFIYQTNIMRNQSRLEVKPRLVFNTSVQSNDSLVTFTFLLRNKGLGPAMIKEAKIIHDSQIYPLDYDFFIDFVYPDLKKYGNLLSTSSLLPKDIVSVNETQALFVYTANTNDIPKINEYLNLKDANYILPWDIEITYESLYEEEEWKLNYQEIKNSVEQK
jgi:hypothetical protein